MPKTKFLRTLLCSVACLSATLLCQAGVSALDDLHAKLSRLITTQFEEPLIATSITSSEDDAALLAAVEQYQTRTSDDDYHALNDFLSAHPKSGWNVALRTNLGLSYYRDGRFNQAMKAWETAWQAGKAITEPRAKALVDRAFGELMRMHARVGHVDRLAALFKELGDRPVSGPATELVQGAREGLWVMRNEPGIAFLCGPMALKNLLLSGGATASQVEFLDKVRSGKQGVSLKEVDRLAKQAKFPHVLVHRAIGQPIPVPSIVHWKVSHYAAIVGEANGRYHLKDPTFGEELWVTRDAIDTESSGYFLVKRQPLEQGWRTVTLAEAGHVRGMGYTADSKSSATTPQDDKTKPACPDSSHGMCNYNISELTTSLELNDTPVGYAPPKGSPVFVKLTYNSREASQTPNFSWNVSQKWRVNWLSYIEDSPTVPGANVIRYVAGGGSINYTGYNSTTGQFTPETRDQSVLVRVIVSGAVTYQRRLANGSLEVYGQSNGATVTPRRLFLTQLIDPAGNAVTLNYDAQLRLTSITDAAGRITTFAYELTSTPLLLTRITDPFGRFALLTYDTTGRLSSIRDVLGLTSSFHYDASSLIDNMTTPYGTTSFVATEAGDFRTLEITDPLGFKERVEYRQSAPGIQFADPDSTVPQGMTGLYNRYLDGRTTFYWDKVAFQLGVGNYTKARMKHWVHLAINGNWVSITGDTVESIKYPLENRIWFTYPNQTSGLGAGASGTYDQPNGTGRVLDDGTTQLTLKNYNALGNVTRKVDALGRETTYEYDPNLIDVLRVKQKSSATATTLLASFTYNSQHLPLTATDAAGQTTTFTYNAAGQVTTVTNALNQKTTYAYAANGNLTTVTNANNKTAMSVTYDAFNRVATRTDSEGYAIAYTYDAFDRVTRETLSGYHASGLCIRQARSREHDGSTRARHLVHLRRIAPVNARVKIRCCMSPPTVTSRMIS